jgi:hypothetical protein
LKLRHPDFIETITHVRRASAKDQLDVMKWLIQKFHGQAEGMVN